MSTSAPIADPQPATSPFTSAHNRPIPTRLPRSYDKRPREQAARRPDWHRFYLNISDRQGALRKKSGAENRWSQFLREEKLLVISWVLLVVYFGFTYMRSAEQSKWLRDEIGNVQQTLSEKIDAASLQLNRCLDLVEKTNHDLETQKARLETDENDWKQARDREEAALQRLKSDVENSNKQLRDQSSRINLLEDKNDRHGAQIEQMRQIQSLQIGPLDNSTPPSGSKSQASVDTRPSNALVASAKPVQK